jgi:methyl-accepting chemotaxis protein
MSDNTNDIVSKIVEANALESAGKVEEAIALYQEIVKLDPTGNYGNVAQQALGNLAGATSKEQQNSNAVPSKSSQKPGAKDKFKLNLRTKTTLLLIGISAFSTIAVGCVAYTFASSSSAKQIKIIEESNASQITDKVAYYMRERFGDIQVMSRLTVLTNADLKASTSSKDKQAALDSFITAYGIYDSVAAFDLSGNVVAQSTGKPLANHRDRIYFQAALKTNGPIISQPILSTTTGGISVYLASPIKDSATGKNIGIMRARMPVKFLKDVILTNDPAHKNYLLNQQGEIFAASNEEEFKSLESSKTKLQAAEERFNFFPQLKSADSPKTIVTEADLVSYIPFSKFEDQFRAGLPDLGWSTISTVDKQVAFAAQKELLLAFAGGTLVISTAVAIIASLIGYKATLPILEAVEAVKQLGAGNFKVRVPVKGQDEIADLSSNINKMAGQIEDLLHSHEAETKQQRKEKELLQQGVMNLLLDVESAKQGDLTVKATMTDGAVGSIADAFNSTMGKLRQLLKQVQVVSSDVGELSLAGEGSVRKLSESALQQTQEIDQALGSIDEINQSVATIANYAQEAAKIARDGSIQAKEGDLAMDATVSSIEKIRGTVANTSKKVKQLAESSQEIAQIVEIISGISEKTNLLAFNASVEAARAGEHGEGFRIVAEEVRRLADRITEATKDIQQLVNTIQQDTTSVLQGMETSTSEVVNGSELVRMTKTNLRSLADTSKKIDEYLKFISTSTTDQTNTSMIVNQKINGIANISKINSTEAQNVVQSLQTLVSEAQNLQASIAQFKLEK